MGTNRPDMTKPEIRKNDVDLEVARRVLRTEAESVLALVDRVDHDFASAVHLLDSCAGRVIVTGMGKSGIIAHKISATLSSTGTPSYFLHPAEAAHGDLGSLQPNDVVLALSQSGETPELLRLLETLRRIGPQLILLTGSVTSTLGQAADVTINCHVSSEACPMNLVPTASTTAALAFGDALAMTLLVKKGFREEDFAHLHPGGQLGKRLLRVERLMHINDQVPRVTTGLSMSDVVTTMSSFGFGMTCVMTDDDQLAGIITDGDLRRHLSDHTNLFNLKASDVLSQNPLTIRRSALAVQALNLMEEHRVTSLVVVDDERHLVGLVHLHDLWRTELF